jgi:hypothetical protein
MLPAKTIEATADLRTPKKDTIKPKQNGSGKISSF